MVLIDSDVILLLFAYQNDPRQATNSACLAKMQHTTRGLTIYNLMEILGQMSFNLSPTELDKWQSWLIEAYQLKIIYPAHTTQDTETFLQKEIFELPYAKMRRHRIGFLDALILNVAERTKEAEYFITWNARHFKHKTHLTILTPAEYLDQR